jgi:hypothetical protein
VRVTGSNEAVAGTAGGKYWIVSVVSAWLRRQFAVRSSLCFFASFATSSLSLEISISSRALAISTRRSSATLSAASTSVVVCSVNGSSVGRIVADQSGSFSGTARSRRRLSSAFLTACLVRIVPSTF